MLTVGAIHELPLPLLPPRAGERGNHRGIAPTRFHNSFRRAIVNYNKKVTSFFQEEKAGKRRVVNRFSLGYNRLILTTSKI
jgi:hypothetical protein